MAKNQKAHIQTKLKKTTDYLKNLKKRNAKNAFIEKYVLCEICCKELLHYYNKKDLKNIKLNMNEIRPAMKGYKFDDEKLTKIFAGKTAQYIKRGTYSAKKMRDSIMHDMNVESMEEVFKRSTELTKLMDSYLRLFK